MTQTRSSAFINAIKLLIFIQIILTPAVVFSGQVTLAWDKNTEPDIAGYRIYCREENTSYNYELPAWEGTETWCVIDNLDENEICHAVVRAYNTAGIESLNSNEVVFQPCQSYSLLSENFFYTSAVEGETVTIDQITHVKTAYPLVTYRWEQLTGTPVALSDASAAAPTFTAPAVDESGIEISFIVEVRTADNLCDTAEIAIAIENDSYRDAASTDGEGSSGGGCFISTHSGTIPGGFTRAVCSNSLFLSVLSFLFCLLFHRYQNK